MKKLFIVIFGLTFALNAMGEIGTGITCKKGRGVQTATYDSITDDETRYDKCDFTCKAPFTDATYTLSPYNATNITNLEIPAGSSDRFSIWGKIASGTTITGHCFPQCNNCNDYWNKWHKTGACAAAALNSSQTDCIVTKCPATAAYNGKNYKTYMVKTGGKIQHICYNEYNCVQKGQTLHYWTENGVKYTDKTCISPAASTETDSDETAPGTNNNNNNVATDTDAQTTAVQESVSALDKIFAGVKANKWRDDEGNFNTARLASDMTAGVVLGTAGALITSSVVKKNQVESGFEDIKCTISGQNVAEFGDDFTVGVK